MSRSYRTRPKYILAQERMPRNKQGKIIFPRIVVRKPRHGDIHPMSKEMIARAFDKLPIEYFYGLKEIELRARPGNIGKPFGKYSRYAKKIILYSVPEKRWDITNPADGFISALRRYQAKISNVKGGIIVEWEEDFLLFMFYLSIMPFLDFRGGIPQ